MEIVAAYSGALSLPVKPDTSRVVMEMVVPYDHVDSSMKLDTAYLGTRKVSLVVYMMDMVILNY